MLAWTEQVKYRAIGEGSLKQYKGFLSRAEVSMHIRLADNNSLRT